jgi:gliding motility-associated-like protein
MERIFLFIFLLNALIANSQSNINPNAEIYHPLCFGDSNGSIKIDISGGSGILNYYWLNGTGVADSLFGLPAGIYTLIVIDALSSDTFNFNLQSPDLLELEFSNSDLSLSCIGSTAIVDIVISGGTLPYSINWSDGNTDQQRSISAGIYEVSITDSNACFVKDSIIITEPDSLQISVLYTNLICDEGANVEISVNNEINPISYLWSTGDTTSSIDVLWDVLYWVEVSDSCGLTVVDSIYLYSSSLNTIIDYDDISHVASIDTVITISNGPFAYIWSNTLNDSIGYGENSPKLCEGSYFVTTNDISNNCSVLDTILVEFDLPFGILDITTTTVYPDSGLWGSSSYTYLWSNGETSIHSNICAGNHWVEVTDNIGCLVRQDFLIEDMTLTLDPSSLIIECDLENTDIDLEVSATGGVEPYSYEWWNGSTENPINLGMSPGDFSVIVSDGNGCVEDTFFVISNLKAECIPNVFTPNGDNINDYWKLEDTFLFSDTEIKIYGRFGRLIFQSIGYRLPWNGTNSNGNDVPDGVYFYTIEIGNGFDPITGTVSILR